MEMNISNCCGDFCSSPEQNGKKDKYEVEEIKHALKSAGSGACARCSHLCVNL